jgi:hypothetical protein
VCCSSRQRESLAVRCGRAQHMLGASAEVSVGLNQDRIQPGRSGPAGVTELAPLFRG